MSSSSNSVLYNGRPTDHLNEPLLEQHWLTDSDNATIMSFFSSNLDYTISSNIESLDLTPPQEAFAPLYNYAAPIFEFPESSCLSALPKPASYLEESQLFFQEETMRSCFPLPHVQPAVGLEPVLATLFSRSEASTSSLTYLPTSDQPSASFSREGYSLGDSFTAPGTFEASAPVLPFPEADCHPSRSPSSASFMSLSSMSDSEPDVLGTSSSLSLASGPRAPFHEGGSLTRYEQVTGRQPMILKEKCLSYAQYPGLRTPDGSFVCMAPECDMKCGTDLVSMHMHYKTEHADRAYDSHRRCPFPDCGHVCRSMGDMRRHLLARKHSEAIFECGHGECNKVCTRIDALKRHLQCVHKFSSHEASEYCRNVETTLGLPSSESSRQTRMNRGN